MKEVCQDVRLLLAPVQPLSRGSLHCISVSRSCLSDRAFDITVEQFIRIEFRGISGQEEKLDLVAAGFKPVFDLSAAMHRVAVNDEKHLGRRLLDQPLAKANELLGLEATFEHHEAHLAFVGERRDDIAAKAPAWHVDHCRLPYGGQSCDRERRQSAGPFRRPSRCGHVLAWHARKCGDTPDPAIAQPPHRYAHKPS